MNILNSMILPDNCCQNTINFPVSFSGVGIHSGKVVTIKLLPANHDTGIIFKRTDLSINNRIKVDIENISSSKFCSKLENSQKVSVSTVEHLLASLHSLSIDNVLIEIDSSELPAMDGSAYEFTSKLLEVGIKAQKKSKKLIKVLKHIKVEINNRSIEVKPSDYLKFNLKINYPNCLIGIDEYTYIHNKSNFINDICFSRTFCLYQDIEKLRAAGYGLGGNLNNAIVVNKNKILNESGLKCEQEFIKHKVLDCLGDFYLAGYPIVGDFRSLEPGHELNNKLLKKIFENKNNYSFVTLDEFKSHMILENNEFSKVSVA